MPMTLVQQYAYFLGVVLIYGSPLILLALYLSWRRRALTKGIGLTLAGCLVGAALAQAAFHLHLETDARNYRAEARALADYSDGGETTTVVAGRYVGTERIGTLDHRAYQFPALDGSDRWLEVVVPPPGINAAGFIRHGDRERTAESDARLVVWPSSIRLNPALAPESFFAQYLPGEDPHALGVHTLIVGFRPRRSDVVYPPARGAGEWIWRRAVTEL